MSFLQKLFSIHEDIEPIDIKSLKEQLDYNNIKINKKNIEHNNVDKTLEERIKETRAWSRNNKKYEAVTNRHYQILDTIKYDLYKKATNQDDIFNKYTNRCISLCIEDLLLAPKMIEYWQKEAKILGEDYSPCNYGSHKYLLKLLEKQSRYAEAIELCKIYIKLGLNSDGTKGGIDKRLEKFIKLKEKQL